MKNKLYLLLPLVCALAGCGSTAGNAAGNAAGKLLAVPKEGGWARLKLTETLPEGEGRYIVIDGKTYDKERDIVDIAQQLAGKISDLGFESGVVADGEKVVAERGILRVYKQNSSVVAGKYVKESDGAAVNRFDITEIQGQAAAWADLPQSGAARYTGKAFTGDIAGGLLYTVDFAGKTGSGQISGLAAEHNVRLEQAPLYSAGGNARIEGAASLNGQAVGHYQAGLFGSGAQEIAGKVLLNQAEIGFGGSKE